MGLEVSSAPDVSRPLPLIEKLGSQLIKGHQLHSIACFGCHHLSQVECHLTTVMILVYCNMHDRYIIVDNVLVWEG